MRGRGRQRLAIHHQVSYRLCPHHRHVLDLIILFDGQSFAAQSHQAFDVKGVLLIGRQAGNVVGVKHHNFAALRRAEIIRQPVHEQMIARMDAKLYHILALVKNAPLEQVEALTVAQGVINPGADFQRLLAVIRRKPNGMPRPGKFDMLVDGKKRRRPGFVNLIHHAISRGNKMNVGNAMKPISNAPQNGWDFNGLLAVSTGCLSRLGF